MSKDIDSIINDPAFGSAISKAMELGNLSVIAPHKSKYYNRYDINWLINEINSGHKHTYFAFWEAEEGFENRIFSQWYPHTINVNGRTYATAEQYMMSEKALLFGDV